MRNSLIYLFLTFYTSSNVLKAQDNLKVELEWGAKATKVSYENKELTPISDLKNSHFDGHSLIHISRYDRGANQEWQLEVVDYDYSAASDADKKMIKEYDMKIPKEVSFEVRHIKEKYNPKASIELIPFIKQGGNYVKLNSVSFKRNSQPVAQLKNGHVFAENSVLASGSGEWYKIRVTEDGVHRISYNFLANIGIDVDNVNPQHINIYGNGFGKLPENNSDFRPDDLLKNAIHIEGEQDGTFDPNDFILFYGRGPDKWSDAGSVGFRQTRNIYARHSAYYININSSENPKRIQDAPLSSQPPSHTVNSYNSFTIHEQDLVNLIQGGQRWYGELFDTDLTQSFSFNIPNLLTSEPVIVRSFMACKDGGGGTNFQLRHNNNLLGSDTLGASGSGSWTRGGIATSPNTFNPSSGSFNLQVTFNRQNPSDIAYLDFIEINARSSLRVNGNQTIFRDKESVGDGNVSLFEIANFPQGGQVWDVTELADPLRVDGDINGDEFSFTIDTDTLKTFVAFNNSGYRTPVFDSKVEHQDLHGLDQADYLLVTHRDYLSQANRLADLHRNQGLSVHVVELSKIYNEFSGGTQDPTAIKFFAKMFYDRADGNPDDAPKYLCLFGNGTYDPLDRIDGNTYKVPVYHTLNSEGYVATLVSDDYFGFLDDGESFSPSDILDISVGRLIAMKPEHAVDLVNKIEHYMKNGSSIYSQSGVDCGEDGFISKHGDWRLRFTGIADNREEGYFIINDLEPAYEYVKDNHPEMNMTKIYSDAFERVVTAGGPRFPDVNREINRNISSGSLVMCYVGHGGPSGAAQERIITLEQIDDWRNIDKLTLFASATCEFARIDDPAQFSAGERMALNPLGGAIALMATSRAVYFGTNSQTTASFFNNVFLRDDEEKPRTFGDIIKSTKNQTSGGNNRRSFILLGDPGLRIALPYEEVVLDSVNGVSIDIQQDTLKALSKARLAGHMRDQFGNKLTNFNGVLQPSLFDKAVTNKTLNQTSDSPEIEFEQQNNVLYRGRVSVTNGEFGFEFIVPKDIDYSYGNGKASFYAFDEQDITAGGYNKDFIIGGVDTTAAEDNIGPEIELFLNDEDFVNGGLTNETPILIAKLFDESGINTVGTGIGHDITVVLNEETSNPIILNEFYESDLDTYKSGSLRYQFDQLEPGMHTLTFKAWDVHNNSSEAKLEFIVQEDQEVALKHVLNYPNPFTTSTTFMFEHNQSCAALETKVEIYTVTGRLVKTLHEDVKTQGFRVEGIVWDGKDDFGDQLAKGVYVYRVKVRNPDGEMAEAMEKLYLLH